MKTTNNKKGFTIIEVVLVLAIAGLIFMMVFIALPALQRAQRDTQRTNDVSRVQAAITQYQSNNRGALPTKSTGYVDGLKVHEGSDPDYKNMFNDSKSWISFYRKYLAVNSGGSNEEFTDPDGEYYSLMIQTCTTEKSQASGDQTGFAYNTVAAAEFVADDTAPAANPTTSGRGTLGASCDNGQRSNVTFDEQSAGEGMIGNATDAGSGHVISIITHATCNGEDAVYSSGARKVAVLYKKEGGGAICVNN